MSNFLRKKSGFFLNLKSTLLSIAKLIVKSHPYHPPHFENRDECYVLGNGPSLRAVLDKNPSFFEGKHVCVVNSFSTTPEFLLIKPISYFIKDGLFFWINEDEFNNPEYTWREKVSPGEKHVVIAVSKAIRELNEKTTWPLNLYIPFEAKGSFFQKYISGNKNINIVYFNNIKIEGFQWFTYNFAYPNGRGNPQFQNVVLMALFQKINEGFRTIYLSGVNANFHQYLKVGDDNAVYTEQHHFYDKEPTKNVITNRAANGKYEYQPLWQQFLSLSKLMYGFKVLEDYSAHKNVKIYNTTKESFIDAFERKYIFDI